MWGFVGDCGRWCCGAPRDSPRAGAASGDCRPGLCLALSRCANTRLFPAALVYSEMSPPRMCAPAGRLGPAGACASCSAWMHPLSASALRFLLRSRALRYPLILNSPSEKRHRPARAFSEGKSQMRGMPQRRRTNCASLRGRTCYLGGSGRLRAVRVPRPLFSRLRYDAIGMGS